jgi:hypothetical protein
LLDIMQANWPELIDPYVLKGGPAVNLRWALDRVRAKLKANAIDTLFRRFDEALRASGYLAMAGQIIDATIVAAPKQRNTDEEKKAIKQGRIPNGWKDKPAKLRVALVTRGNVTRTRAARSTNRSRLLRFLATAAACAIFDWLSALAWAAIRRVSGGVLASRSRDDRFGEATMKVE